MIYGLLTTLVGILLLSFGMSQQFWHLCVCYSLKPYRYGLFPLQMPYFLLARCFSLYRGTFLLKNHNQGKKIKEW